MTEIIEGSTDDTKESVIIMPPEKEEEDLGLSEKNNRSFSLPSPENNQLTTQLPQAMGMIETLLTSGKDINIEALDKMVDLQLKMMGKQAEMDYAVAMTQFNSLKKIITTNRAGTIAGGGRFQYADYGALVEAITPWLAECGLSFTHRQDKPVIDKGMVQYVTVYCTIRHNSGHSEEFEYPAMLDERLRGKLSPSQLLQQAVTYAKRQTLNEGLGLATEEDKNDDDSQKPVNNNSNRNSNSNSNSKTINKNQCNLLTKLIDERDVTVNEFIGHFKIKKIEELGFGDMNVAIDWIKAFSVSS
jgi:ERF superfamily protein